jgi:hypothetical protein
MCPRTRGESSTHRAIAVTPLAASGVAAAVVAALLEAWAAAAAVTATAVAVEVGTGPAPAVRLAMVVLAEA